MHGPVPDPARPDPGRPASARPATARPVAARALAPDVARGLALLAIAVANTVPYIHGRELGPSFRPVDAGTADRLVDALAALVVDNRALPLFAALLGYGMAQSLAHQRAAGVGQGAAEGLLVRRFLVLLALGALHAGLLFSGDILGLYALLGLLAVPLLRSSDAVLLVCAALSTYGLVLYGVADGQGGQRLDAAAAAARAGPPDLLAAAAFRLGQWGTGLLALPIAGIGLLCPVLLGMWAGRRGLLDRPERHRRALRRAAVAGLATGVAGGVPLALTSTRRWQLGPGADAAVGVLHVVTGIAGGLGLAAAVGLAVARRARPAGRAGPVAAALAATGRRSLTSYLGQSLLLAPLLAPWGLALGGQWGTARLAALAVAVWLATVLAAVMMERAGRRGPAEAGVRALVYGRAGRGAQTDRHSRERSSTR